MDKSFDLIVVGAGLVGCAFALDVVQRSNLKVALVECRPMATVDVRSPSISIGNQRVVALGMKSIDMLRRVGIFDKLTADQAHGYTSMRVWDESSNGELSFDASDVDQPLLGYMVDSQACTSILQEQAISFHKVRKASSGLTCFFDTEILSIELAAQRCQLFGSDQFHIKAPLVVAADGSRSWVRQQAKIQSSRLNYEQRGIVAKIRPKASHQNCAWQRFSKTGPVAMLPLHDNYCSIVWSLDSSHAEQLLELPDDEFCALLGQTADWKLGEIAEVSPRQSFPLISQQAQTYIAPGVALMGDAAHSIHPLAGQGANLGFKDADCLANLILSAKPNEHASLSLLAQYQKERRPDNRQTDLLMTLLNQGFKTSNRAVSAVRGLGMNWINQTTFIKKLLAEQAMGI
ncbi:MAG: FAD-dependent monooxygenase [Gammaproteobacteria bacterium]|nr:FAD-dependent monooxygenase [Gammaproteobacteria bacterium]